MYAGRSGGRAFMGDGVLLAADAEHGIFLCTEADGALIAKAERSPHLEDITAMAAFPDGSGLVSGDRDGRVVVWAVEGGRLSKVQEHTVGGLIRSLVSEPRSGAVVAVNGTERIHILSKDGSLASVALADADRASCIAVGNAGEVLVGSHQGSIYSLRPADRDLRRVHSGSGQRVEVITTGVEGGGAIAFVDGVRQLHVVHRGSNGATWFRSTLSGIPNAMAFGSPDVVYLAFSDRTIRREFTNSFAMADRVCGLIGKPWTAEEWAKHIGEGTPETVCGR